MAVVFRGRVFSVEVDDLPLSQRHDARGGGRAPSPRPVVLIPIAGGRRARRDDQAVSGEHWPGDVGAAGRERQCRGDGRRGGARECEEEIAPGAADRLERIRGLYPCPGFCDEELIYFRVSDLRPPPPDSTNKPDEDEDIHVQSSTRTADRSP